METILVLQPVTTSSLLGYHQCCTMLSLTIHNLVKDDDELCNVVNKKDSSYGGHFEYQLLIRSEISKCRKYDSHDSMTKCRIGSVVGIYYVESKIPEVISQYTRQVHQSLLQNFIKACVWKYCLTK